jgi:hypothetical protein
VQVVDEKAMITTGSSSDTGFKVMTWTRSHIMRGSACCHASTPHAGSLR